MTNITASNITPTPEPIKDIELLIMGVLLQKAGGKVSISIDELRALAQSNTGVRITQEPTGIVAEIAKSI